MTTEDRLEFMEEELRRVRGRIRWLLALAGLCLVSTAVVYALGRARMIAHVSDSALREVRATNFVLEDGKGKTRASLGMSEDGPVLRLNDEKGNMRAALYVHDKAGLSLSDENGKPRAVLGVTQNVPLLCLYDEKEEALATLIVTADGAHLLLRDEKGKPLPVR